MNLEIRVVLVDDHPVLRWGFRQLVDTLAQDIRLIRDFACASEALAWLSSNPVDVAVVDIALEGRSGLDLVQRLNSDYPHVKTLVYSRYPAREFALRAFRSGAAGYIDKRQAPDEIVGAIRQVSREGTYLNAETAEILKAAAMGRPASLPHEYLTPRESEVFRALLGGNSVTQIARKLNLSVKTISTHRGNIFAKLGVTSLSNLVRYGIDHGVEP